MAVAAEPLAELDFFRHEWAPLVPILEMLVRKADRKTNREIAGELFLSDKTIESHLRNIFVKLGVSSRVDVARAVERDRAAA